MVRVLVGVGVGVGVGELAGGLLLAGGWLEGLGEGVGEALRDGACEAPISASDVSNSPVFTPLSAASVYAFQISAGKLEPPARPPPAVPVRVTCLWVPGSSPNIATTVTSSGV